LRCAPGDDRRPAARRLQPRRPRSLAGGSFFAVT
jgi:hypothetical protein